MKNPKKPTRQQKEAIEANGLIADSWLVVSESEFYMKVVHKVFGKVLTIDKYRQKRK